MSLEKIANRQQLTKQDIVAAAHEMYDLEKQAAEADAYGRAMAHELVKQAAETETKEADEKAAEEAAEAKKKKEKEEAEKKSSDNALSGAIEVLKKAGVIK